MRHERDRRKSYEMLFPMEIPCGWPGPGCVEAGGTVSTEAGAQHRHPRPDEEAAEMMGAVSPRRRGLQHTRAQRGWPGRGTLWPDNREPRDTTGDISGVPTGLTTRDTHYSVGWAIQRALKDQREHTAGHIDMYGYNHKTM